MLMWSKGMVGVNFLAYKALDFQIFQRTHPIHYILEVFFLILTWDKVEMVGIWSPTLKFKFKNPSKPITNLQRTWTQSFIKSSINVKIGEEGGGKPEAFWNFKSRPYPIPFLLSNKSSIMKFSIHMICKFIWEISGRRGRGGIWTSQFWNFHSWSNPIHKD